MKKTIIGLAIIIIAFLGFIYFIFEAPFFQNPQISHLISLILIIILGLYLAIYKKMKAYGLLIIFLGFAIIIKFYL